MTEARPSKGCTPAIPGKPRPAGAGRPHTGSHGLHRVKKRPRRPDPKTRPPWFLDALLRKLVDVLLLLLVQIRVVGAVDAYR